MGCEFVKYGADENMDSHIHGVANTGSRHVFVQRSTLAYSTHRTGENYSLLSAAPSIFSPYCERCA